MDIRPQRLATAVAWQTLTSSPAATLTSRRSNGEPSARRYRYAVSTIGVSMVGVLWQCAGWAALQVWEQHVFKVMNK